MRMMNTSKGGLLHVKYLYRGNHIYLRGRQPEKGEAGVTGGPLARKKGFLTGGAYPIHQPGQASHPADGKRIAVDQPAQSDHQPGRQPSGSHPIQGGYSGLPGWAARLPRQQKAGEGMDILILIVVLSRQACAQGL